MLRSPSYARVVATLSLGLLFSASAHGQAASPTPDPSSAPPQSTQPASSQPPSKASATPAPPAKASKVWTNENLGDANGPVSVVGDPKKAGKGSLGGAHADPQYIANTKKQLEKLQTELGETDKKIADLKSFLAGETVNYTGYQLKKGYDREPVDEQIHDLEEKKKQTQGKIDALLEEARKKGVQPGDLR